MCGREKDAVFVTMRRQHPVIESTINNLENRSFDRVRVFDADGFARVVTLSIVAFNIHRIGLLLCRKAGTGTCARTPATTVKFGENHAILTLKWDETACDSAPQPCQLVACHRLRRGSLAVTS